MEITLVVLTIIFMILGVCLPLLQVIISNKDKQKLTKNWQDYVSNSIIISQGANPRLV